MVEFGSGAFPNAGHLGRAHRVVRWQDQPGGADRGRPRVLLRDGVHQHPGAGRAQAGALYVDGQVAFGPKDGGGMEVKSSALTVRGKVPALDQAQFEELREAGRAGLPGLQRAPRQHRDHGERDAGVVVVRDMK